MATGTCDIHGAYQCNYEGPRDCPDCLAQGKPPRPETIEGVGGAFLIWARDTIVDLQQRVRTLEAERPSTGVRP